VFENKDERAGAFVEMKVVEDDFLQGMLR